MRRVLVMIGLAVGFVLALSACNPAKDMVQVAAGSTHTCALFDDGTVGCWGRNNFGQLGDGTTLDATAPVTVAGLTTATSITVGAGHTCATRTNNTVVCWGANSTGQLGNNTTTNATTPVEVTGLTDATSVSGGGNHTCALRTNSTVACWGYNATGQLGNNTTATATAPVGVSGLTTATAVSAGASHSCATRANKTVVCWGANTDGQLGNNTTANATAPVVVSGLTNAATVSAGGFHSCATRVDFTVVCWGRNASGQLGNTTTTYTDATTPVVVSGLTTATSVSAGVSHTCATRTTNTVVCWGFNSYSQLGTGTTTNANAPVEVTGLTDATTVSVGDAYTCAVRNDTTVSCWGYNYNGQLGTGATTNATAPASVQKPALLKDVAQTATGNGHSCALFTNGTVACWGNNQYGQLGNNTTSTNSAVPVTVTGLTDATSITAGLEHTCATRTNNTVACWGNNGYGQLGNGNTTTPVTAPVTVTGLTNATSITAGNLHTCATRSDNTVACWGNNGNGQLGNGNTTTPVTAPVTVTGLTNATSITGGGLHTCATRSDNTVACWGYNNLGQLGNGTRSSSPVTAPVTVTGLTDATSITAGSYHTCATRSDNTIACWGGNTFGQLGQGTSSISSSSPVTVTGLTTATSITGGLNHTCATRSDHTIACWGDNTFGQLGNGTASDDPVTAPVTVTGLTNATSITGGGTHTCATRSDHTVACWGDNIFGQLGDSTTANRTTPVAVLQKR